MSKTDLYLRLGVNTQAWREFCRAEQLLVQRDALLAALRTLSDDIEARAYHLDNSTLVALEAARAAIAKVTQE